MDRSSNDADFEYNFTNSDEASFQIYENPHWMMDWLSYSILWESICRSGNCYSSGPRSYCYCQKFDWETYLNLLTHELVSALAVLYPNNEYLGLPWNHVAESVSLILPCLAFSYRSILKVKLMSPCQLKLSVCLNG